MKLRCKTCKKSFARPTRGRKPLFCSAACRQKAYRKREADPFGKLKVLLKDDLYTVGDQDARGKAAIKVLEELGYEVHLTRARTPRRARKPKLRVVGEEDEGPTSA